jgi:phenylpropionate dioxygenase-like ring-hydroxylating dioxygenase large terminal subunit
VEKEAIFWRTWQPVGRTADVQRHGDFFTREVLGEPMVITRGTDGELRPFFNVCKHRARPEAAGNGNRKSLQCQYHGWTYGLDGRLCTTPEFDGVVETFTTYSKQHAPMRPASDVNVQDRDRRYLRTEAEEQALYYWFFPNVMLNFYPDNLQINIILPMGNGRTRTIFEWYFEQPGTGAGWESMQQSVAFSDQVQQEEFVLCEAVQRGLQSQSYNQGRFSVKRENGAHHFHGLLHHYLHDNFREDAR